MRRPLAPIAAAALAALLALPAVAQSTDLTLRQVETRYPRMSPVHIMKCDTNGDRMFDRGELACVSSIYSVMYAGRNN